MSVIGIMGLLLVFGGMAVLFTTPQRDKIIDPQVIIGLVIIMVGLMFWMK